jgi:hypothetical protein
MNVAQNCAGFAKAAKSVMSAIATAEFKGLKREIIPNESNN